MYKIKEIVSFLNPGQVPVLTADQPIYAVAKQVQWHWPEQYGENKFVIMFGGLHMEMAALKSSSGTAESFLTKSSITRTRQIHPITSWILYQLLKGAYTDYCTEAAENSEEVSSFDVWCEKRKRESPQLQSWHLVLYMELVIILLIRAFREATSACTASH